MKTYGDSCFVYVSGSKSPAIVDKEDFLAVSKYKYHLDSGGYAARNGKISIGEKRGDGRRLHQDILDSGDSMMEVVFLNGDRLDCRRKNIALMTTEVKGSRNRLAKNNTSGFKGVSFQKRTGKWVATICAYGKKHHLGSFEDKTDAAKSYDAASRKHFGLTSITNKDMGLYK